MWTPWDALTSWGRDRQLTALENARVAAVACSRARVERIEIELYVEEAAARRTRTSITA